MNRSLVLRSVAIAALAAGLSGCTCPKGYVDSVDGCTQVVNAFTQALTGCQLDTSPASMLCQASCGDGCVEQVDIDACRGAMVALGCDQMTQQAVVSLEACAFVLDKIADDDCASGDDDDLFDD